MRHLIFILALFVLVSQVSAQVYYRQESNLNVVGGKI